MHLRVLWVSLFLVICYGKYSNSLANEADSLFGGIRLSRVVTADLPLPSIFRCISISLQRIEKGVWRCQQISLTTKISQQKLCSTNIVLQRDCYYVCGSPHRGSLVLLPDFVYFKYSNGSIVKETITKYNEISQISSESKFFARMCNLQIMVDHSKAMIFSGITDSHRVKDMIIFIRRLKLIPNMTLGFNKRGPNTLKWKNLENPVILHSQTLNFSMDEIIIQMANKEVVEESYAKCECSDISVDCWEVSSGFKERTIKYNKLLIVPKAGTAHYAFVERQRLFNIDSSTVGIIVNVEIWKVQHTEKLNLIIHIIIKGNGNNVEYKALLENNRRKEHSIKSSVFSAISETAKKQNASLCDNIEEKLVNSSSQSRSLEREPAGFNKMRCVYKKIIISLATVFILLSLARESRWAKFFLFILLFFSLFRI